MVVAEHETKFLALLSVGLCVLTQVACPLSLPWLAFLPTVQ